MNQVQQAILGACIAAEIVALAGLARRGRLRLCWSIAAYMLAQVVIGSLILLDPAHFYRAGFYVQKEALLDVLQLCMAVELVWRVFRAFPGARARARIVLAPIVALTALAMISMPSGTTVQAIVFGYQPHIALGTIWLLASAMLLAAWFVLPVHALHRAVLQGLTMYLGIFGVVLQAMREHGLYVHGATGYIVAGYVNAGSFLAMLLWIALAAWRPPEAALLAASPALLKQLRLEAI